MEDVASIAEKILVLNKGKVAFYGSVDEVFSHDEELKNMGLNVPQITRIFAELGRYGFNLDKSTYTIDDAAKKILRYLQGGGN